jgi:tRNA pseudouridine55 synthase
MKTQAKPSSNISGILLLNKSQGMSSNTALQKIKRLFNAAKAGHTGSLDPLATGMLPICLGEATKISQYLLDADKCYETTGVLGIKTNTSDSTGEVIAQVENFEITVEELQQVLLQYLGTTQQVPSMFSALKHQGTPLYRLARQGIEIERKSRDIHISQLNLDQFDGKHFSLTVSCSKGTYIRNLVEDIGEALHVGAHVTRLHRLYTAGFANHPMYTIDEFTAMTAEERNNCLISMDFAIEYLKPEVLSDEHVKQIRQGLMIQSPTLEYEGCVRLYNLERKFIGIGDIKKSGLLRAKRLLAFSSTT